MNQATKLVSNRIAIAFDFDRTLIPDDSFYVLLNYCQIDIDSFVSNRLEPLVNQGWDKYLAKAYGLIEESRQRQENKITRNTLRELGQKLKLYDGVPAMFEWLKKSIKEIDSKIELEFYLISGGFVEMAQATSIAKYFQKMWGCEFHYNEWGEIEFIKRHMTHTEKTRYLYYLSKGIDTNKDKDLIYSYPNLTTEQIHVPLDQVIYVGDGTSDIPCFTVMNQYNGITLGIYPPHLSAPEWQHRENIGSHQKLTNLAPANYEKDSEIRRSLLLAIDSLCKKIALRKLSRGE